jgi:hypothetical protein
MGGRTPSPSPSSSEVSGRPSSPFRGYRSIEEFLRERKLADFAAWLMEYRPKCCVITISRTHHDLLRRWPKAAGMLGIIVTADAVFYRGFKLQPDYGARRYARDRPPAPTQTDIEKPT